MIELSVHDGGWARAHDRAAPIIVGSQRLSIDRKGRSNEFTETSERPADSAAQLQPHTAAHGASTRNRVRQ